MCTNTPHTMADITACFEAGYLPLRKGACSADAEYAHEELKRTWQSQGPRFKRCWHIAIAGKKGRIMILKWDDFQPLASIPRNKTAESICDLKFTPAGAPTPMLAAACRDTNIYTYNVAKGYQCAPHAFAIALVSNAVAI